jgi:hypothetical protein
MYVYSSGHRSSTLFPNLVPFRFRICWIQDLLMLMLINSLIFDYRGLMMLVSQTVFLNQTNKCLVCYIQNMLLQCLGGHALTKERGKLLQAKQAGNMLAKGDRPSGDLQKATWKPQDISDTKYFEHTTRPASKCKVSLFRRKDRAHTKLYFNNNNRVESRFYQVPSTLAKSQ